ncbi:hypothetical protein KKA13_03290 [Patescibacteria group bacterium]|nr:hypothetical protein [Patescibacteria group bacterium]
MMRLNLNMLSPERKKRLSRLIDLVFLKSILAIITLFVALVAIILLWGWQVLAEKFNGLSQNTVSITKETSSFSRDIGKINYTLREVSLAGNKYAPITPKLTEIINSIPSQIIINSINLSRETNSFETAGTAVNRDVLLNFEDKIKTISWLTEVSAPRSQLFQKDDVKFVVRAKLNGIPPAPNLPPSDNKPE